MLILWSKRCSFCSFIFPNLKLYHRTSLENFPQHFCNCSNSLQKMHALFFPKFHHRKSETTKIFQDMFFFKKKNVKHYVDNIKFKNDANFLYLRLSMELNSFPIFCLRRFPQKMSNICQNNEFLPKNPTNSCKNIHIS